MARRSSACVISSTATHMGFIARSSIIIAVRLPQPESTSVCAPRSNCGTPPTHPASSIRSSATATRAPASDSTRMQLRSSVVFPEPGAPAIRHEPVRYGRSPDGA